MRNMHTYITGFLLSLLLTVLAVVLVWAHEYLHHQYLTHEMLYVAFVGLAVLQLLVQLSFFLHLGTEPKPRWNVWSLCFALFVVAILIGGTLWIMHNLSHGQMRESDSQIFIDEAIHSDATQ